MTTYYVTMTIETPDDSQEPSDIEQAVRGMADEQMWQVLTLTVLETGGEEKP